MFSVSINCCLVSGILLLNEPQSQTGGHDLDRMREMLRYINKEQRGIEIGPYHNPLAPRRLGFNSLALDVFDTEELRRRAEADPHIPRDYLSLIENVDLHGSAVAIADLVRARFDNERFDYVISSHNFEHLPDPIRFLQGCEQVLKPGAILSMAIPDRRYCFDFYRPVTELSEWLDAFHEKRAKPTPSQVFRHGALHSVLNGQIAWGQEGAGIPTPAELLDQAFADWQTLTEANGAGAYRDAHCSAFTPASFELLLADARYVGLTRFDVLEISGPNGCEFYVHLRNPFGAADRLDRSNFYHKRSEIMARAAVDAVSVGRNVSATSEGTPPVAPYGITVAAIIPLYNGAQFIREALESVLAQTEPADEIIVVDDGSTDDGAGVAIVKEMAKDHSIQLLTKTNGGQGSARNTGIAACSSSHIAPLDQDDIWYEDHLAILKTPFLKSHRRKNLGLVYGNVDRIDKFGRMVRHNFLDEVGSPHPKTSLLQCLNQDMFILPGASLFSKAAWEQAGRFDDRLAGYEDDDLFIRMFSAGIDSVYLKMMPSSSGASIQIRRRSPRMAKSRMIYFRKLIASYPDDHRLKLHSTRDAIGPRFFNIVYHEFLDASKSRDIPRITGAWTDLKEVLPFMPRRLRRRMSIAAPLISALYSGPLRSLARRLFRWAVRRKR